LGRSGTGQRRYEREQQESRHGSIPWNALHESETSLLGPGSGASQSICDCEPRRSGRNSQASTPVDGCTSLSPTGR
jgi:hypothetical protein